MKILGTFYELLTSRERRNLYLLFCAVFVMAGLEVVSVGSIMPFLQVAADPASIHNNPYLHWGFETFGFEGTNTFLIALGLTALTALVISNGFIVLTTWALYRYAWGRNHTLSRRLLQSYLHRPYEYFLTRNSARLGKNILEEVKEVVNGMLLPSIRGGAKAIVALFIIGFLVLFDPVIALLVSLVLGCAYTAIYFSVRSRLDLYGEKRVDKNTERYQFVNEAFSGIKEVKLKGKENTFISKYSEPSKWYSRYQARYVVIKRAPRYILEAVAFGGIILIAVYLIAVQGDIEQVIPTLGLYAFAGYRLMPALQQAFKGIASAHFNTAALRALKQGMQDSPKFWSQIERKDEIDNVLTLNDRLTFDSVCFTYPGANEPAITGLSFEIRAHTAVGFVGKTGSGKTTTVDLILGLLRPQDGTISIDRTPLVNDTVSAWQQNIGYVPQQIYLSDDSVAQNIAFGVPRKQVNIRRLKDAARRAQIYDFVDNELPDRWETVVGERGVKLSGGQRQRIGIARALYHNPSVLLFDEATSALDQKTEASVMEAIYDLEGDHTMIMVAHRLTTVQRADNIIMLEGGQKIGEGTYDDLAQKNSSFKSMSMS